MAGTGLSIAGRKRNTPTDLYQTPPHATEALLDVERFAGEVWEPASGRGAISQVLTRHGLSVTSSDIMDDGYGQGGVDFLSATSWRPVHNIVTNPPYKDALAFIETALTCVEHKAAFLLKLTFLESRRRRKFFETSPPSRVWVFSDRLTMWPDGDDKPKNGGTIAYAWFVWDMQSTDTGKLGWI
jgi:hypothetical protein